ncbi:hypothetical protein GCM10029964_001870 [Kibdelosporangium lantanae]
MAWSSVPSPSRNVAKHSFPVFRTNITRPVTPTTSPVDVSGGRPEWAARTSASVCVRGSSTGYGCLPASSSRSRFSRRTRICSGSSSCSTWGIRAAQSRTKAYGKQPGDFQRDTSTLDHVTTPDAELRARRASSFGAQAAAYAEHRPDYPATAIDWIVDDVPVRNVLDLAAGTGKLTESLLARGYHVTAVEPDVEMLAELRRRCPDAEALAGTAEDIPLPDAAVDAVFVGQAFHWFDVPKALAEIGRVLVPGGVLGMLWNYEDDRVDWVVEYEKLVRTGVSRGTAQNPFPDDHPVFGTFERELFDHSVRRTAEGVAAMVATHSHMLVATDEERTTALGRLVAYLKSRPETADGEFDLPMRTITVRAHRQG